MSAGFSIGDVPIGGRAGLVLIAGPCQLETRDHALFLAEAIAKAAAAAGMGFIFKGSFDKANRTAGTAPRGPGMAAGLEILARVRAEIGCPVLSDVHEAGQCGAVAEVCDVLQIPAFLCRQTDLLVAAGETGRAVNIKKGQFLAPWDMTHVAAKVRATGNDRILLCERGTSFGYNTLVSDFRALPVLAQTGYPVVFDATHSVQQPGGAGARSGGQRAFVATLARAAVAVGLDALFIETHEAPDSAPSDGPNMVPLVQLGALLGQLAALDRVARTLPPLEM